MKGLGAPQIRRSCSILLNTIEMPIEIIVWKGCKMMGVDGKSLLRKQGKGSLHYPSLIGAIARSRSQLSKNV